MSERYEKAGVSLQSGYESIERIKSHIASTKTKGFNGDIGGFGGLFDLFKYKYKNPVLVSGTDGVGTKLLLAIQNKKIDTVGIDLVAMCVNDILTSGAEPLFFLDYIAVGKNHPTEIERIVSGIADGCRQSSMSLIGGETAEMPDMYAKDHFDLAGFAVGVVDQDAKITGSDVKVGDVLIGLPSSGVHSNGFSLVRQILTEQKVDLSQKLEKGTVLDAVLEPTRIYVKAIRTLLNDVRVKAMSHVTGGGFYENLPRMIDASKVGIELQLKDVKLPEIFPFLMEQGQLTKEEMYHIFNMGIGFVVVVSPEDVDQTLERLRAFDEDTMVIGKITSDLGLVIHD